MDNTFISSQLEVSNTSKDANAWNIFALQYICHISHDRDVFLKKKLKYWKVF